jgi:hypothetical protein
VQALTEVPLRTDEQRVNFCDDYFSSVNAPIVYRSEHYREYRLPRDIDKQLTDRPYYWLWVEQTSQDVPETILRLAFSDEAMNRENERLRQRAMAEMERSQMSDLDKMFFRPPTAELFTLGSFRMDKIFAHLETSGACASVTPVNVSDESHLIPWLMVNVKVSYRCDLVEQELLSLGICLTTRQIVEGFYDLIQRIEMRPISPTHLLDKSSLTWSRGLDLAKEFIKKRIQGQSHTWALDANTQLQADIAQIRAYYKSILPDLSEDEQKLVATESLRKEHDLIERTAPKIEIQVQQLALVGLIER